MKIAVERQRTVLMGIKTVVVLFTQYAHKIMNRTRKNEQDGQNQFFNETLRICDENEQSMVQEQYRTLRINETVRCESIFCVSQLSALRVSPQLGISRFHVL